MWYTVTIIYSFNLLFPQVCAWVAFVGVMTYVRVSVAQLMRAQGDAPLFYSGCVTQAGSAVGAVVAFLLVNVANVFTPYYPCSSW